MRKIMFVIILALSTLSMRASVADLFTIDKATISSEMTDLNTLESYVEMNQGITLTDVQSMNSALTTNVLTAEESPFSQTSILRRGGDAPLGIPSFVWGFCLNLPGIAIVYFVADDKDETMKALWGCVASTAVWILFDVIYILAFASAVTTTTTI
jgi:hypothetical protein